jgi:hypothetical protein
MILRARLQLSWLVMKVVCDERASSSGLICPTFGTLDCLAESKSIGRAEAEVYQTLEL